MSGFVTLFLHSMVGSPAFAEPAPAPAPAPRPASSVKPAEVRGLWIGSTSEGSSFKLTVLGQTDADIEGTVELQKRGEFVSLAFIGRVEGNRMILDLDDSAAKIELTVDARKVTGKIVEPGAKDIEVSAIH